MAHINLLPWREELREERKKEFFTALIIGLILALAVFGAAYLYTDGLVKLQQQRNTDLQKEISKLDTKIAEIAKLDEEREKLLARMNVIQNLQSSRPKVVKGFDALVRSVPEGIHLEKVTRQGRIVTFDGVAQSNARVSVFMQSLKENPEFDEDPKLAVIQRTSTSDNAIRKFTLLTTETKVKTEEDEM